MREGNLPHAGLRPIPLMQRAYRSALYFLRLAANFRLAHGLCVAAYGAQYFRTIGTMFDLKHIA